MMNQETSLPPEIEALLDGHLAEWRIAHQLAPAEVDILREKILSSTHELPADWWSQHMVFFNGLMKQVDTAQEAATQMLSQVTVNVQTPALSFTTFSGGSNWQPYLKLT